MATQPEAALPIAPRIQNLGELLRYLPKYQVIICKDHGAIRSWASHLRDAHSISAKERKALNQQYQLSQLQLVEPRAIALPPSNQPPIQALGPPLAALQCNELGCNYITISRNRMQKHCHQDHSWFSSKEDRQHWTPIQAQTFFRTSGYQQYFQVQPPLPIRDIDAPDTPCLDKIGAIVSEIHGQPT
jgi:hypothetical protein